MTRDMWRPEPDRLCARAASCRRGRPGVARTTAALALGLALALANGARAQERRPGGAGARPSIRTTSSPGYLTPEVRARLQVDGKAGNGEAGAGTAGALQEPRSGEAVGSGQPDPARSTPLDRLEFVNGWPVVPGAQRQMERGLHSDFDLRGGPQRPRALPATPSQPPAAPGGSAVVPQDAPAGVRVDPRGVGAGGGELESPLTDVFRAIGEPHRFLMLRGVSVVYRLELYDDRGGLVGSTQQVAHLADVSVPRRDRWLQGDLVFGRDGRRAFAERGQFPSPRLDERAARILELHGLLLRAPWIFADTREFTTFPPEVIRDGQEHLFRVRIERVDPNAFHGPLGTERPRDRFELICRRDPAIPEELRYTLAETGARRRVVFKDWQEVDGIPVRIPHRREVWDENNRLFMVLQMEQLRVGQVLTPDQFRPR